MTHRRRRDWEAWAREPAERSRSRPDRLRSASGAGGPLPAASSERGQRGAAVSLAWRDAARSRVTGEGIEVVRLLEGGRRSCLVQLPAICASARLRSADRLARPRPRRAAWTAARSGPVPRRHLGRRQEIASVDLPPVASARGGVERHGAAPGVGGASRDRGLTRRAEGVSEVNVRSAWPTEGSAERWRRRHQLDVRPRAVSQGRAKGGRPGHRVCVHRPCAEELGTIEAKRSGRAAFNGDPPAGTDRRAHHGADRPGGVRADDETPATTAEGRGQIEVANGSATPGESHQCEQRGCTGAARTSVRPESGRHWASSRATTTGWSRRGDVGGEQACGHRVRSAIPSGVSRRRSATSSARAWGTGSGSTTSSNTSSMDACAQPGKGDERLGRSCGERESR